MFPSCSPYPVDKSPSRQKKMWWLRTWRWGDCSEFREGAQLNQRSLGGWWVRIRAGGVTTEAEVLGCSPNPRDTGSPSKLEKTRNRFSPRASNTCLLILWDPFWTFNCLNCMMTNLCCFTQTTKSVVISHSSHRKSTCTQLPPGILSSSKAKMGCKHFLSPETPTVSGRVGEMFADLFWSEPESGPHCYHFRAELTIKYWHDLSLDNDGSVVHRES